MWRGKKFVAVPKMLKALGSINRLRAMEFLADRRMGICELASYVGVSQGTMSYHVQVLLDAGLVFWDGWCVLGVSRKSIELVESYLRQCLHEPEFPMPRLPEPPPPSPEERALIAQGEPLDD